MPPWQIAAQDRLNSLDFYFLIICSKDLTLSPTVQPSVFKDALKNVLSIIYSSVLGDFPGHLVFHLTRNRNHHTHPYKHFRFSYNI